MNNEETTGGEAQHDTAMVAAGVATASKAGTVADTETTDTSGDGADGETPSQEVASAAADADADAIMPIVIWSAWEKERRSSGQEGLKQFEGGHAKLRNATSMLAIEIVQRSGHDWRAEADTLGISVPKSDHTYMAAAAVTFAGTATTPAEKQSLAKHLDRQALAVEWLVGHVKAKPSNYLPSEEGIAAGSALVEKNGGITRVSGLQRKANPKKGSGKTTQHTGVLLDPEKVREVRLARAQAKLQEMAAGRDFSLGIIYHEDNGLKVALEVPSGSEDIETALLQLNVTEPLVDQFGELLQAGEMIAEEQTDIPRDPLDDPEDPEGGMRMAFIHFVFGQGDDVVMAPVLLPSAVVVVATPRTPLFPEPLEQLCHLRTRERRILQENIADVARRAVFSGSWGDVGDTQGIYRLVMSTEAAMGTAVEEVSCLVEPLRSPAGNLPLNVDVKRFSPQFTGQLPWAAWKKRHANFIAKVLKAGKDEKLEHTFKRKTWKIAAKKKDDEDPIAGDGAAVVAVMEGDWARISATIATMPVISDIKVEADRNSGICLSFGTKLFNYRVFVPSRMPSGGRNASLFSPFVV